MTVFYTNRGNPYYLKYSLAQTRTAMPHARIILLGDASNAATIPGIEHYQMSDFADRIELFGTIYQHFSPNDRDFELMCFERWFHIASFVARHKVVGPVLCLDSDVLLYRNVFSEPEFIDADIATTKEIGPAFTYFGKETLLKEFANFIVDLYSDSEKTARLRTIWETGISPFWMQEKYVSDMQVLGFYTRTLVKVIDLSQLRPSLIFDYAFHISEGFLFNPYKRIKRIWWGRNSTLPGADVLMPYGILGGEKVFFAGLHFQVGTKIFIPRYYRGTITFSDRYKFRLIYFRGMITTAIKWIVDGCGKAWRTHARKN